MKMRELWEYATTPAFDPTYTLKHKGRPFRVRVPVNGAEKNRGYRLVPSIASDECMLFMYDEAGPMTFTMEHCLVGLRIVFCDGDYNVLQVSDAQPGVKRVPCRHPRCQNVVEFGLGPGTPDVGVGDVLIITRASQQSLYALDGFFESVFGLN